MSQRRHSYLYFSDVIAIFAVIEKPGNLRIVHVLDVRVLRVSRIDGHPNGARPQKSQHAKQNARVVRRVNRSPLLTLESLGPHCARDPISKFAHLAIGVANILVDDCSSLGVCRSAFIEVIYGTHLACFLSIMYASRKLRLNMPVPHLLVQHHQETLAFTSPWLSSALNSSRWPNAVVGDAKPTLRGAE